MFIVNRIILLLNWLAIVFLLVACVSPWVNPESFTIPAFFGLAFPFIFLANVLCLVWWLIFKKFRMLYSGIVLVLTFSYWNRSFNVYGSAAPAPEGSESSKIMSYNVRLFDLYNWIDNNKTKKKIFDFLKEQNADIYCFQEFFHQDAPSPFVTRDSLTKILKANHFVEGYTHKLIQRQHFGLAIFSVYPVIASGEIKFENDPNNNAVWADLKRKTDTIRVYNVHLSSLRFQKSDYEAIGQEPGPGQKRRSSAEQQILSRIKNAFIKRVSQTNTVLDHVKTSPYKNLVCGDFNDTPVSYCYGQFSSILNDAFASSGSGWGATYTGRLPLLRIDYIWYSDKLNASGFKTHDINLSDHYPISCTVY
ncbi:MAG TPA: endonuclease/exonuclease/phosphatase family protein [Flavobacteriales bacterium]|nr:endonuclease/exonuclease/phosphatase family protein [Flavobacteriales bacterium]